MSTPHFEPGSSDPRDVIYTATDINDIPNRGPVLIKASAEWCGPCKRVKPLYERFATLTKFSHIPFYEFDIDEAPELTDAFEVHTIPLLIYMENGRIVDKLCESDTTKVSKWMNQLEFYDYFHTPPEL